MDKEEAKRLVEVDESVRQSITENEKQLVETRFYKEFVINTEKGPLVLNDVYITVERNKENDMEYHFRWVQENEDGEATLEEKLMIDKDGKAFSIEAFEDFLQDLTLDGEILFEENDKEKGRLAGITRDDKNRNKPVEAKTEKKQEQSKEEEKKVDEDLKKQGKDLKLTNFRKITDKHLEERMPEVFNNSIEYAMAYSETLGSFVILQKSYQMSEDGKMVETWEQNENIETAGTNYKPIISVNENGDRVEQKVPLALLRTSEDNKEIAVTLNAKDYGELDIETVDVMPCGNDTIHEQKRVARPVGMQGEGNLQGDGVESLKQRYDFYDSGKDQNGTPNKAHAIAHGATELMEEGGGRENGVIADEDTEIPGTSLTYGDLAKFTGVTIQELVEHEGEAEVSIMDRAQEIEEKIKEAAKENKMTVEGYKKELIKAPGKNIEEKIENANEAILEQYMGSSGRGR